MNTGKGKKKLKINIHKSNLRYHSKLMERKYICTHLNAAAAADNDNNDDDNDDDDDDDDDDDKYNIKITKM